MKSYDFICELQSYLSDKCGFNVQTIENEFSKKFSELSYSLIHNIENLLRRLILEILLMHYGKNWEYIGRVKLISDKSRGHSRGENLLQGLNFKQLLDCLGEAYPEIYHGLDIYRALGIISQDGKLDIHTALKYIPTSNWDRFLFQVTGTQFSDLQGKWTELYNLRNYIAHNIFIDSDNYFKIRTLTQQISNVLTTAIEHIDEIPLDIERSDLMLLSLPQYSLSELTSQLSKLEEKSRSKNYSEDHKECRKLNEIRFSLGNIYYYGINTPKDCAKAYKYYLKSANYDYGPAQRQIGHLYEHGDCIGFDITKAEDWYVYAIGANDIESLYKLASLYERTKPWSDEILNLYVRAANSGHVLAQRKLGDIYDTGSYVDHNEDEAGKWYFEAAIQGDYIAQFMYGDYCRTHNELNEAISWYKKSATRKYVKPILKLAQLYSTGQNFHDTDDNTQSDVENSSDTVYPDIEQSIYWYTLAADLGSSIAQKELASLYELHGKHYEAIKWLKLLCDSGDAHSCSKLGKFYEDGIGVYSDRNIACMFYKRSSELGDPNATFRLGEIYEDNNDVDNAITYYLSAHQSGILESTYKLADLYQSDESIEIRKKSVDFYIDAATRGHLDSQYELALIYKDGILLERNVYEAISWFEKSALSGDAQSCLRLAEIYESGNGVDKNIQDACKWYLQAQKLGFLDAEVKLTELGCLSAQTLVMETLIDP